MAQRDNNAKPTLCLHYEYYQIHHHHHCQSWPCSYTFVTGPQFMIYFTTDVSQVTHRFLAFNSSLHEILFLIRKVQASVLKCLAVVRRRTRGTTSSPNRHQEDFASIHETTLGKRVIRRVVEYYTWMGCSSRSSVMKARL